jgi:glutathione S-transferase
MKTIKISAFRWAPPAVQGLVRDLRVRWALEEAGLAYEEQLVDWGQQSADSYRALQPFGQIPAYQEDGLTLFESGAIVLHIAERSSALMPAEANTRARVKTWMFAALNTVETPLQQLAVIDLFNAHEEWARLRRPTVEQQAIKRLGELARQLEGRLYLEGGFSAADLMMVHVLRLIRHTSLVAEMPVLQAYLARCEARPAFQRALVGQMSAFADNEPAHA